MKKFIIFLSLISESETHTLYRFITHRVKYFKPLFIAILMIMAYRQWKPKIQCLRKLEYYIRSIKKDILNRNVRLLKNVFISMHSILGWASFCMNYCINAACHGGNQPVALLRCNGSPGCFDSSPSGHLHCWVWCLSSSSWQYLRDSLWSSWCTDSSFSSLLVKLSQVFESALLDTILKLVVIPVACAHCPTHFFLPVNFSFNMLWYSTHWIATPFSNDPLWLTLFVEGVNDRLLDHFQVSSVPHYCGFKEHDIPRIYTVWMVIYKKLIN